MRESGCGKERGFRPADERTVDGEKMKRKIIVRILIGLAIIIAIPLIVALFIEKEFSIKREVIIAKPKQEVFDYIKYLKNGDNYNVWLMMDPSMKKEFKGTDGTVGFIYAWDSKDENVGTGEQEITKLVDGERVDVELRFKKPFEGTNHSYMTTEALGENQTKVKSVFLGQMNYPMNLIGLWCKGMMNTELQKVLDNLKNVLEKSPG